jgi:hypothetical protein
MPPSKLVIVAVDGFDNSNHMAIQPKKFVPVLHRASAFPNMGPHVDSHVDIKKQRGARGDAAYDRFEGGEERVQLLLLTTGINPLVAIPATSAAWAQDGIMAVAPQTATAREGGFGARTEVVATRRAVRDAIQVFWRQEIPRNRAHTTMDPSRLQYIDGSPVRRVSVNARNAYVSDGAAGGYTPHSRAIWTPSGVQMRDIGSGDVDTMNAMTAIG